MRFIFDSLSLWIFWEHLQMPNGAIKWCLWGAEASTTTGQDMNLKIFSFHLLLSFSLVRVFLFSSCLFSQRCKFSAIMRHEFSLQRIAISYPHAHPVSNHLWVCSQFFFGSVSLFFLALSSYPPAPCRDIRIYSTVKVTRMFYEKVESEFQLLSEYEPSVSEAS